MVSKAVLGSLAALAAVALVWLALERGAGTPQRARESASRAPAEALLADAKAAPIGEPPGSNSAREPVASVSSAPAPSAPAPSANPLFAALSGRVLDPAAAPIAGAEIVVRRPEAGHFSVLDLELAAHPAEVARARTGADGRFAFELERGIPFELAVSAADFCDDVRTASYAGEELEIVLAQGFLASGRVTRARDGGPIAGARVRVFQMGKHQGNECTTTTAADGSYRLRFSFRANATLEVTPRIEMSSAWFPLELGADGTVQKDVALADGIEVRGRVVAAGSRAPIEGALVGEGWTFRRSAQTDALGEYVLRGFGAEGVQELYAQAAGFGKEQRVSLPAAVDGVMRVDFELARGRVVRGRVVDRSARPIAGAYVGAVASEDGAEGQRTDWISGRTDAGGRFELTGLTPELRHCVLVSAGGFATMVYDFPVEELDALELELGDLALAPPAVLSGTVQDEKGNPLANMQVILGGANRDRARLRGESQLRAAADWYVDSREAESDAQGRFWFGALPSGDFRIRARMAGQPDGPRTELTLDEGELREGFVLLYPQGESIRGTVVDAQGNGLGGVYVISRLREARAGAKVDPQRGTASSRTDASGAFELRGLVPGAYHLDLHPYELESDPESPWLSTALEKVESGGDPLRVELPRGASIRGRLVDSSGAALVGYSILGRSSTSPDTPFGGATREDGSFRLEVRPGTIWDLEVRGAPQTDAWDTVFHTERAVAAGTRELVLQVDVAHPPPAAGEGSRVRRE